MTTSSSADTPAGRPVDHRPAVARTAAWAAGGFATAVGSLVTAAGELQIPDGTVRFAITVMGIIAALAQSIAAVCVWRQI